MEDVPRLQPGTIVVPGTMVLPIIYRSYGLTLEGFDQVSEVYRMLTFAQEARDKVCKADIGVHLRMGDVYSEGRKNLHKAWLRAHGQSGSIYMATDTLSVLQEFKEEGFGVRNNSTFLTPLVPGESRIRETSTMDSAADMLSCVHSTFFLGSSGSSFTEMILHLRHIHNRENADKYYLL